VKKNILICGASGFIGKNLVLYFAGKKKYNLIGTYHKKKSTNNLKNIKWIKTDLRNFDQCIKVTKNMEEISKMAQSINADFYIIIYPWPDTLEYGQKKFNWEEFANNLCETVSCTKLINLFPDFRYIKESSNDWVDKLYIKQDLHLREFGHKIVAEKILKVAF